MRTILLLAGALLLAGLSVARAATPEQCTALASRDFSDVLDAPTRVTAAKPVAASGTMPAACRVEGYVAPQVGIEFLLPLANWNGKFLMQGCGAMCGTLEQISNCTEAVGRGYACGTTDMGHRAPMQDGKWAYSNPLAEIDLGHRGTHVATLAGKAITAAFYGSDIKRSYFRGCSTGGRQGLVEAQRYPYDFDGIIAGASVLYVPMGPPLQLTWDVMANLDTGGKPIMPESKLKVLAAASMNACDAVDGLKDGLISDPRACKFDPATLLCKGGASDQCLTPAELAVVRKFYDGPRNAKGPLTRVGGQPYGTELGWEGFLKGKGSPSYGFALENLRYLGFALDPGPSYDVSEFNWDRDPQRLSYSVLTAGNPDISLFAENGGKLIMFHGWADASIPATVSIRYYEMATRTLGGRDAMERFARLFLMPGLGHCKTGGTNLADMLGALDAWVEGGKAPDLINAYGVADKEVGPAQPPAGFTGENAAVFQPKFSRPLFPYPDQARYQSGDPNVAASFKRVHIK